MQPKVTIGFCVKNCETTVEEAIESILNQDYPHELMEVIIVDGNSTDNTMAIIKEKLKNSNIKTRFFSENKGLGFARQLIVDHAEGDYIIWVDGDMVLARDHTRRQVDFMEANPTIGIAGGKFIMYPEESIIARLDSIEWMVLDYLHGKKASLRPTLHRAGGCIYRIKAIREIGGFDCNIKGALEDLDAEYRMGDHGWYSFFITDAIFNDRRKETLEGIWRENFWYGYGGHYFIHKHGRIYSASKLFEGFRRASVAYKLTSKKIVFLLPFQYLFKKIAWFFGFLVAHIKGYGHNLGKP